MSKRQQGLYIGGEFVGAGGKQARGGLIILGGYAIIAGAVTVLVLAWMFHSTIAPVLFWTGSAVGVAAIVFIVLAGVLKLRAILFETMAQQQMTALSIERQQLENDRLRAETEQTYLTAPFLVVKQNETLIHLPDRQIAVFPAKMEAATEAAALPEPAPIPLDLLDALTDPKTAYAIIGPQRSGKTYAAMHLTDFFARQRLAECWFIGVKAEPNEWPNCVRYLGERDIRKALRQLLTTVNQRHADGERLPRVAVFLDDWINIAAICGDLAEEWFTRAATDAVSAGVVPYFLLQSDSNADWGNRKGAMLKNNFTKLTLTPVRDHRGHIDHAQTRATLSWPGDAAQRPVALPAGAPELRILDNAQHDTLPPPPDELEELDALLWDVCHKNPGLSYNQLHKLYAAQVAEPVSKPTFNRHIKRIVETYDLDHLELGSERLVLVKADSP